MTRKPHMLALGIALLAFAVFLAVLAMRAQDRADQARDLARVRTIVDAHCVSCHSAHPTDPSVLEAPGHLMLDSNGELLRNAGGIYDQVAVSPLMPPGNLTELSDADRVFLGSWALRTWERQKQGSQ